MPGAEGPWRTYARMRSLRTPKHLTGPDLGIPSLTPRAWYEARHGSEAWAALGKISRHDWADYLGFRRARDRRGRDAQGRRRRSRARRPGPRARAPALCAKPAARSKPLSRPHRGARDRHRRRRALGDAAGAARGARARQVGAHGEIPSISPASPAGAFLVVGGGASAFDNAAEALEHGAASRHRAGAAHRAAARQPQSLDGIRRVPAPLRRSRRRVALALHAAHLRDEPASAAGDPGNRCTTLPCFSVVTGAGIEAARRRSRRDRAGDARLAPFAATSSSPASASRRGGRARGAELAAARPQHSPLRGVDR